MKGIVRVLAAVAFSAIGFAIPGCSKSSSLDVPFLASDVHFMVGGQQIVIPVVAMRRPDHSFSPVRERRENIKEKLQEASDPAKPMKLAQLDLLIREYQYTSQDLASFDICHLLKRDWSQALCRGQHRGVLRRLPEKFDLLDRERLDILKRHWTVGKELRYDQVKDMAVRSGVTEIGCDKQSQFCTAMVEVLPGLLAIWTVWSDDKTGQTAGQMAETQGAAIVQFVRRAIGPAEDPTLVIAD